MCDIILFICFSTPALHYWKPWTTLLFNIWKKILVMRSYNSLIPHLHKDWKVLLFAIMQILLQSINFPLFPPPSRLSQYIGRTAIWIKATKNIKNNKYFSRLNENYNLNKITSFWSFSLLFNSWHPKTFPCLCLLVCFVSLRNYTFLANSGALADSYGVLLGQV